ncbi:MAG: hypothetical protein LBF58_12130 [Deltaproteobacteria bacterium]|jgi:hypothetical protein|nr:hypothetical protein [Deltaproteobacteria bacterium]
MIVNQMTFGFFSTKRDTAVHDGLRIAGKKPEEVVTGETASETGAVSKAQDSDGATLTFSGVIQSRLEAAGGADSEAAATLADQLSQVASYVSDNLGKSVAIQFQNAMLNATARKVNEGSLSNAIGFFFRSLEGTTGETADFPTRLKKTIQYLNDAGDPSGDGDTISLTKALNAYFGQLPAGGSSRKDKEFNESFDWVTVGVPTDGAGGAESDKFLVLSLSSGDTESAKSGALGMPGGETLKAVDWLLQTAGNENAARFLEENYQSGEGSSVATAVAILARENDLKAAHDFVQYLNANVAPGVDSGSYGFAGWNLGQDYSAPGIENQVAGEPSEGPLSGFRVGDADAEANHKAKRHLGLLANYVSTDPETGATHVVPVAYDLDQLFLDYANSKATKSIDAYV